jgi:Asp-tRNA(Asn)/Glu-tRNA(Gln) amidotransferase A subunit family amidase
MALSAEVKLHELTVVEAARAIAQGDLSPVDYLEALLERIHGLDSKVQAWSGLDIEGARAQAKALAEEARTGRLRGPLHGVPTGVKEEFAVRGLPDRSEPNLPPGPVHEEDATAVARLRAAGAIVLGKTYMPGRSGNPPTRNPWNLEHTAGGTSSGSGAAVGARMVPFTLGEQTYGSNLRPAAFCGVEGFKPSFGRVSRAGMWTFTYSQDHPGIIGLSVEDMALVLSAIAGPDPRDPAALDEPPPPASLDPSRLRPPRIGLVRNFFPDRTEPGMQAAVEAAASRLAAAGAKVESVHLPEEFGLVWHTHAIVLAVEGASINARKNGEAIAAGERPTSFISGTFGASRVGELIPSLYYLQAQRIRRHLRRVVGDFFRAQNLDVLLTATAPGAAPKGLATTGNPVLLAPWSHLGLPALSLQSGQLSPEGLPLGIQLAAPPLADYDLLCAGAWVESTLGRLAAPALS